MGTASAQVFHKQFGQLAIIRNQFELPGRGQIAGIGFIQLQRDGSGMTGIGYVALRTGSFWLASKQTHRNEMPLNIMGDLPAFTQFSQVMGEFGVRLSKVHRNHRNFERR